MDMTSTNSATPGYVRIKARYTGDRKIAYRWLAEVGSGTMRRAQDAARLVDVDTFSSTPDGRVPTRTLVHAPVGILVVEKCNTEWAAGIVADGTIDWSRAQHVACEVRMVDHDADGVVTAAPTKVTVHTIRVDGVDGEYTVSR